MQGPVDFTPYLNVAGLGGLVWFLMIFIKRVMPDHPERIPYVAVGLAVVVELGLAAVSNLLITPNAIAGYAFIGIMGGLGAIGIHETTSDKIFPPAIAAAGSGPVATPPKKVDTLFDPPLSDPPRPTIDPSHRDPPTTGPPPSIRRPGDPI